jgi:hypothetical protein
VKVVVATTPTCDVTNGVVVFEMMALKLLAPDGTFTGIVSGWKNPPDPTIAVPGPVIARVSVVDECL